MLGELTQETVRIPGPQGGLAGELAYPDRAAVGMILLVNPHPHMGGGRENFLIACLAGDLAQRGWVTLRFDYSGTGESEGPRVDVANSVAAFWETGQAPEDPRFVDDVRAAADWMRAECDFPLAVIGYSFGAYAAVSAMQDKVPPLVLISPTISQHDLSPLRTSDTPKLVVYSHNDFATPASATRQWFDSLPDPKQAQCFEGGQHFYRQQEREVAGACAEFLRGVGMTTKGGQA